MDVIKINNHIIPKSSISYLSIEYKANDVINLIDSDNPKEVYNVFGILHINNGDSIKYEIGNITIPRDVFTYDKLNAELEYLFDEFYKEIYNINITKFKNKR